MREDNQKSFIPALKYHALTGLTMARFGAMAVYTLGISIPVLMPLEGNTAGALNHQPK